MEKFLLKNMTPILFTFMGAIFFTWLFQYLDLSAINFIDIPFLKIYGFEGIISTFQMFTTIGAIFAFWYGYKRYEQDKYLYHLEKIISKDYLVDPLSGINKLELLFNSKEEGNIPLKLWYFIDKDFWLNFKKSIKSYIKIEIDNLENELEYEINSWQDKINIIKIRIEQGKINKSEAQENINKINQKIEKYKKIQDNVIDEITEKITIIFTSLFNSNNTNYTKYVISKFELFLNRESQESVEIIFTKIFNLVERDYLKKIN